MLLLQCLFQSSRDHSPPIYNSPTYEGWGRTWWVIGTWSDRTNNIKYLVNKDSFVWVGSRRCFCRHFMSSGVKQTELFSNRTTFVKLNNVRWCLSGLSSTAVILWYGNYDITRKIILRWHQDGSQMWWCQTGCRFVTIWKYDLRERLKTLRESTIILATFYHVKY